MRNIILTLFALLPAFLQAQTFDPELTTEDLKAALKLTGINIFKYDFDSAKAGYKMILFLEEMVKDSVITRKEYTIREWKNDEPRTLTILSKVPSPRTETYWINVIHPRMQFLERFDIQEKYRQPHYWKEIKQGAIVYEKKTPLLFYSMAWPDTLNGVQIMRFCWGDEVDREMKNETLKKVEHMILISYMLVKK